MAKFQFKLREFGSNGKSSSASVHATDLTAGNFVAQETAAEALRAAIAAVSLGTPGEATIDHQVDAGSDAPSSDPQAQRENKWLVSMRETSGNLEAVTFTIPCADLDQLATNGEDMADGANKSALITAIEAYALSRDGVAVNVESIKFRARTL